MKKALLAILVASSVLPAPIHAGAPASDPDLVKGKELVRRGEYETAVLVLDQVVRRLDGRRHNPMVADAHLHLGIAYAGLGRSEAARSQFVEALRRDPAITLDPKNAPPAALDIFSEVWRERADKGTVAVATPPPPSTSTPKMGSGLKIGLAAAALAIGVAAALTGSAGTESTEPRLAFVPVAPSPYVQLVAAVPDAGATLPVGQTVTVTVRSSIPPTGPQSLNFHLVAEATTSAGQPCLSGQGGPFGLAAGGGSITATFSLSGSCPPPFTTTSLVLSLQDVATRARPYSATYQGTYRVVP